MDEPRYGNISRRRLLTVAGATAAGLTASGKLARLASAHHLSPTDPAYRFAEYEAIIWLPPTAEQCCGSTRCVRCQGNGALQDLCWHPLSHRQ